MANRTPVLLVALLLVSFVVLAGCAEEAPEVVEEDPFADIVEEDTEPLHGFVFDEVLRPLRGATVELLETGEVSTTDEQGGFAFEEVLLDEPLILVAKLEGYESVSKQTRVQEDESVQLDFVLAKIPPVIPYNTVQKLDGFISCEVGYELSGTGSTLPCDEANSQRAFDLSVDPAAKGIIVEFYWETPNPLGDSLRATLVTLDAGDLTETLDEQVGRSGFRVQVGQGLMDKHYDGGGRFRLEVEAYPVTDGEEAALGVAAMVTQEFEAFVSVFYHAPPDPTYSFQG